jgi:MoaA/NifB/PqqE/SkfB family radical SAM enzyme
MKVRAGQDGIHIFCRSSGVNVLVQEVRCPESTWARAPRYLSVALTNSCELRCPYCYAPKSKHRLNPDQLLQWLSDLSSHGLLGVGFGGGEPTLHPDFVTICRAVATTTDLAVTFTTHGHRLNGPLLQKLAEAVHFIRLSMDGVGVTYERLRGRSFSRFQTTLSEVRQVCPFGINFVVNSETVQDLDAAVEIAINLGAREFLLLPERPALGRPGIDSNTRERLIRWAARHHGIIPLAISESEASRFQVADPFSAEHGLSAYAHIDAKGTLRDSSYSTIGTPIGTEGILAALSNLKNLHRSTA